MLNLVQKVAVNQDLTVYECCNDTRTDYNYYVQYANDDNLYFVYGVKEYFRPTYFDLLIQIGIGYFDGYQEYYEE